MTRTNQRLELTWFNKDKALIPTENGKYGYSWVDPRDPRYCETRTLVEGEYVEGVQAPKEDGLTYSVLADLEPTTDNLLINGESGDVLEALTRVPELADKYLGQVKLCYIDPPFNTEKTFTHYEDNLEHSVWLTMMRDRLVHIKKLLAAEGSIWVHLDDSENHRMRCLLDEVFGPGMFVTELAVEMNPKGRQLGDGLARSHDSIYVYSKTSQISLHSGDSSQVDLADFPHRTGDGIPFRHLPLRNTNKKFNPTTARTMHFPIYGCSETGTVSTCPFPGSVEVSPVFGDGSPAVWRWSRRKIDAQSDELHARMVRGRLGERLDIFQIDTADEGRTKKFKTVWPSREVGSSDSALNEIKALFAEIDAFATPKPERLLERIIHISTNPGDVVLDVFAGSGTTAAVAHKMGRRWVTAELLSETVKEFTLPRLTKLVRGEDPGGITSTDGERVDATEDGLPGDLSGPEAFALNQALGKIAKAVTAPVDLSKVVGDAVRADSKTDEPVLNGDEVKELRRLMRKLTGSEAVETDFLPYVRKAAGDQLKTRKSPGTINWRGGGGFQVATMSPECFDYGPDLGLVTLTPAAFEGDTLARTVAAHMNFHLTPEDQVFTGKRGRTWILVTTADATPEYAAELVTHLANDETLVLASTSVDPDTQQALRKARRGSRVVHIPNELFRVHEIEG